MDLSKLNILQKIVLAMEEESLLAPQGTELKLVANNEYLVGINIEKLERALKELEEDYGLLTILKIEDKNIFFRILNTHFIDSWSYKIRHGELGLVGEFKVWDKLKIAMDRSWLKYEEEKIEINLNHKSLLMLIKLIDARGSLVEFKELAEAVDLSTNMDGTDNSELADGLKAVRRDIVKPLVVAGLSESSAREIRDMILAVRGRGYKLRQIK